MQDYADYKVMTQENRRKLFSLLQVLKRELDGAKPASQVRCPMRRLLPVFRVSIRCPSLSNSGLPLRTILR